MKKLDAPVVMPPVSGYIFVELDKEGIPAFVLTTQVLDMVEVTEGKHQARYKPHSLMTEREEQSPIRELEVEVLFDNPVSSVFARYEGWSEKIAGTPSVPWKWGRCARNR